MRAGLGQKVGKAGEARPFANDVEEIAVFPCCAVGEFPGSARPRIGSGQPDKQRSPWSVLQIADHPVGPFPPPGGKIVATDTFGILRQVSQQICCFP